MKQPKPSMENVTKLLFGLLTLGACANDYRSMSVQVSERPNRMTVASELDVPDECPIYTPTGGDIDTPELPFMSPILFGCALDDAGTTYGVVTGDSGELAILDGDHELGMFFAFDSSVRNKPPTVEQLDLDGLTAAITAWSAPVNVSSTVGCCAENSPGAQIPLTVVALGAPGILLSLGHFDSAATQVALVWDLHAAFPNRFSPGVGYTSRFYVNGEP